MEQEYLVQQNNKGWIEQIASQSILVISVFTATTSYSFFINKDLYDIGFTVSVGFWCNLLFYFICKLRCKSNFVDDEQIKKNFLIIDVSLLLICYLIIMPLFVAYNIFFPEKLQSLSIMILFSQLSFYTCALFSFLKNDQVKEVFKLIENFYLMMFVKIAYYSYGLALIVFFVFFNDQSTSHHKFIYSSFTVSLVFMGIFRLFNLKNLGKFFQIIFSSTVIIISWKQTQNPENTDIIQSAYGFLLTQQIITLFYYACQFLSILFHDSEYEQHSSQQTEGANSPNNMRSMFVSNATYIYIVQSYLQQLALRISEEKEKKIFENLTQDSLEKVINTFSFSKTQTTPNDIESQKQEPKVEENKQQDKQVDTKEGAIAQEHPQECPICSEEYQNEEKIFQLNCSHQFHASCLTEWVKCKNTCPLCRNNVLTCQQIQQFSPPKVIEKDIDIEDMISH